jgi:hypothetical protein
MRLGGWIVGAVCGCVAIFFVRCGGSKECASTSDCDTGQQCVFGERPDCSAKGTCANPIDNCDSTFGSSLCGCHHDTVKQAKCYDVTGFLGPVSPLQHCFDPDASTLFPPDGSDDVGSIHFDSSARDAAPPADATSGDAHDAD